MGIETVKELARKFLSEYNPNGLVPFPFAEAIDKIGDIKLFYLDTSNPDVSGAIFLEDNKYVIVINSAKPTKRQYFTLAHEMGHYILHKDKLADSSTTGFVDFGSLSNTSSLLLEDNIKDEKKTLLSEKEANTFAVEILMPEEKVREFYELNGDVKETADAFQVSVADMAVRLEKLGLV